MGVYPRWNADKFPKCWAVKMGGNYQYGSWFSPSARIGFNTQEISIPSGQCSFSIDNLFLDKIQYQQRPYPFLPSLWWSFARVCLLCWLTVWFFFTYGKRKPFSKAYKKRVTVFFKRILVNKIYIERRSISVVRITQSLFKQYLEVSILRDRYLKGNEKKMVGWLVG